MFQFGSVSEGFEGERRLLVRPAIAVSLPLLLHRFGQSSCVTLCFEVEFHPREMSKHQSICFEVMMSKQSRVPL